MSPTSSSQECPVLCTCCRFTECRLFLSAFLCLSLQSFSQVSVFSCGQKENQLPLLLTASTRARIQQPGQAIVCADVCSFLKYSTQKTRSEQIKHTILLKGIFLIRYSRHLIVNYFIFCIQLNTWSFGATQRQLQKLECEKGQPVKINMF